MASGDEIYYNRPVENTPSLGPAPTPSAGDDVQDAAGAGVEGARRRVLDAVEAAGGEEGPTVGELAAVLGGHENTVRHHLSALVARRLVDARTDPSQNRRGRPAVRYRVTAQGHAVLASGRPMVEEYVALAGAFAQRLAERGEPAEGDARAIGTAWGTSLHGRGAHVSDAEPVPLVLTSLTRLGFSPVLDPGTPPGDARVLLRTCPLLDAARTYPQVVCTVHRGLVEGLLAAAGGVPGRPAGPAGSTPTVTLEPFAEPGACILRLRTAPATGRDADSRRTVRRRHP